jgi:hypothetical protein
MKKIEGVVLKSNLYEPNLSWSTISLTHSYTHANSRTVQFRKCFEQRKHDRLYKTLENKTRKN